MMRCRFKPVKNKRPPLQVIVPLFDGRLKFEKTKLLHFAVTPNGTRPSNRPCLFDGILHEKKVFHVEVPTFLMATGKTATTMTSMTTTTVTSTNDDKNDILELVASSSIPNLSVAPTTTPLGLLVV